MNWLVAELEAAGYRFTLAGDKICLDFEGEGEPDAQRVVQLIDQLRLHKAEVLDHLRGVVPDLPEAVADWPEDWLEVYIERAGIMEFDGGLSRAEAERRAKALVRESHRRTKAC